MNERDEERKKVIIIYNSHESPRRKLHLQRYICGLPMKKLENLPENTECLHCND